MLFRSAGTEIKQELRSRNQQIYSEYLAGAQVRTLAEKYYLSVKSIQRILREKKK